MEPELIPSFVVNLVRLQRRLRWSRERLVAHRARELARLRAFAVDRSPLYRELHRGLERRPLAGLPILDRGTLLARFDELVTDRRLRLADLRHHIATAPEGTPYRGYRVVTSTGTGGGPVSVVVANPREWAFDLASTARARDLAGRRWSPGQRDRSVMIVSPQRWQASSRAADSLRSRISPVRVLDASAPIPSLVRALNDDPPDVLSGYGTVIGMLADEQLAGRLRIRPHLVHTGGEVTLPEVRRRITAAFGTEPFDYYGSAEGGTLAAECREGRRLHLFEDTTIIEVVDEGGQPVPRGEWGARVLVTPLWLRTLPLIRFALDDSVRVATDPCPCGRSTRTLDGLRGRSPGVLSLPAADGDGTVAIPWLAIATSVLPVPVTYRSFGLEDGVFVMAVGGLPPGTAVEGLRVRARAFFAAHGAVPPRIEVRPMATIPRGPGGKAAVGLPAGADPSATRGPKG